MDAVLRLQSVPLALVFVVAGLSKLHRPRETASVLRAFRLASGKAAELLAVGLAVGEILLSAVLLVAPPRPAGILALAVLAGVTAVVIRQIVTGAQMDCGCFGGGLPSVVSWSTVARNAVVSIPAFFLLSVSSTSLPSKDELLPALSIVSLEACGIFLIAAALSMQSVIAARSKDWAVS